MGACNQAGCDNPALWYSYLRQMRLCRECFRAMVRDSVIDPWDFTMMQ